MKRSILIFATLLACAAVFGVFQSCNSGAALNIKGTVVKGKIANAGGLQIFLDQINYDNSNAVIAKAEIDNNGNFEIPVEDGLTNGIYRIRIGAKKAFLMFDGSEKTVTINGDLETFESYAFEVDGSATSKELCGFLKNNSSATVNQQAIAEFVKNSSNPLMASFIMIRFLANSVDQLPLAKEVSDKLSTANPDSKYARDYKQLIEAQEAQIASMQANQLIQVGLPAPDINLETPDGKKYALSDLKGKIVLLDFWASWCGPCRKANPHVVETYKKYKDKGFTVYSVSLDGINPQMRNRFKTEEEIAAQLETAKKKWVDAIEKDGLVWDAHVSDLKHWNSIAAQTYGVRSIPQTFLIDRDGKISAINPRNNLEEAILKIL